MKNPSVISFLTTLLLALTLYTHGEEFVRDAGGGLVDVGVKYFIQPVNGNGGGLVPAAITVLPFCPLGITQTILPYQPGLPVTLTYPNYPINDHVLTVVDLSIEFQSDIWPVCQDFADPKLWVVAESDAKEPAVLIGGKKKSPKSYFIVEVAGERTYKLKTEDGYVGTTPGAWLKAPQLLVTKDKSKALIFKFKKVDDDVTKPATSTSRVEKLGLKMFPFY